MNLTEAEWSVMECLWKNESLTGRAATELLESAVGWSRSTTLTLLRRLEAKGAVGTKVCDGLKTFFPLIRREDAAMHETESFLDRVYNGSLSLMVSSLTKRSQLSHEEIDALYGILKQLEEEK